MSNSKLLKGFLEWDCGLTFLSFQQSSLHILALEQIAVSFSDSISRHSSIGTITAVGSPLSSDTY
jgi:hypothetical protein